MDDKEKLIDVFCAVLGADPDCRNEKTISLDRLVDGLIANGVVVSKMETTTKWIPVTERLPDEPLQTVLVTNGAVSCVAVYSIVYDEFAVMCGKGRGQDKRFGVTHWMPLPEPPKGE